MDFESEGRVGVQVGNGKQLLDDINASSVERSNKGTDWRCNT